MRGLVNALKIAARMADQPQIVRVGTITAYDDTGTGAVKVMIQPNAGETGWIPLLSPWIGAGWGMVCAPSIGDPVEVHFELGSTSAGFAGLRFFNDSQRAPPAKSGEFWLVHKTGSALKFTNDGNVALVAANDLNVTVGGNLTASVTGNLTAEVGGNAQIDVDGSITASAGSLDATITGAAEITVPDLQINGNLTVLGLTTTAGLVTTAPTGGGAAA